MSLVQEIKVMTFIEFDEASEYRHTQEARKAGYFDYLEGLCRSADDSQIVFTAMNEGEAIAIGGVYLDEYLAPTVWMEFKPKLNLRHTRALVGAVEDATKYCLDIYGRLYGTAGTDKPFLRKMLERIGAEFKEDNSGQFVIKEG
ncbi:hypothetical protein [Iodobacter sp.]|uniref:hypothetical protein n=1 Tax=Iodobacter sp. TaxID=1915058 RepID=UPI0025F1CC5F|nr:hypothetical protein [Iodobacter sp.]